MNDTSSENDDCELCDGTGELDVPKLEEYGNVPCPDCVSLELRERISVLQRALWMALEGVEVVVRDDTSSTIELKPTEDGGILVRRLPGVQP